MRKCFPIVLPLILLTSLGIAQKTSMIPLEIIREKTHVTIKIGEQVIPQILLDTGFGFNGLMIYNLDYRDSLDLTGAMEVKIPGAGSGEPATGLMLDSATFCLGDVEMTNQRLILLTSDIYKGFPSNGIMGYSIFGHYVTEFNYDENVMILHPSEAFVADSSWTRIPLYFKGNNVPWLDGAILVKDEEPIQIAMYIDYAAGDPVLLLEKPDMKFELPENTEDVHIGRGLSGDIYGKTGYISNLIIGGFELKNVKASIASASVRSKQKDGDAILGIGSLRRFNLIFDYAGNSLYIKPNSHFDEPF